ncbi:hypothetical protein ACFYRY_29335 [Streptomyces sp. NPDC005263]|uniref:hypothetical protein n=1 Tax=Streptomyces sp. NPDC005263 TaxID=3364711 RepID=UPI0036C3653A
MQGTNDIGGGYGEVPSYDGAEYAYAHGYEYSGAARTATSPWDPAPWDPAPWDSPHGDVLTVPFPEFDPLGPPVTEPDVSASESGRPVASESPGRRHRRPRSLLRATRLLLIPAGGYVALLISAMLGGPGISSPLAPQPESTHPGAPRATAPDSAPDSPPDSASGTGPSTGSPSPTTAQTDTDSRPGARKASGTTDGSTSPTAPADTSGPTDGSTSPTAPTTTSEPTAEPTRTTSPTPAATLTPSARGRALGSSHKPVK